jgi:hypothetical protein
MKYCPCDNVMGALVTVHEAFTNVVGTLRVPTGASRIRIVRSACRHTECADYITARERLWSIVMKICMILVAAPVMAFSLTAFCGEASSPIARKLGDYTGADGKPPTGKDSPADDSVALAKALAAGPGVVAVGPGLYRFSNVIVPEGVTLIGSGPATVVRPAVGAKIIFRQKNVARWSIREMILDGQAQGKWRDRKDEGQSGIWVEDCRDFTIAGVTVRNFNGAGIHLTRVGGGLGEGWGGRGDLDLINAQANYIGVRFDFRCEYSHAQRLTCQNNVIGCVIHGGNMKLATCNFTSNIDGIFIEDKENGSHGAITNCLCNHNERYALVCRKVENGMAIDNSCFFGATIRLDDSKGVNITSGIIGCSIETVGKGVNRIAGNYVIPRDMTYTFTPQTIVQDNFTDNGPWDKNRRR